MRRTRPKVADMDDGMKHSYDHRGDLGKYANIYKEDVETWRPDESEHELAVFPYKLEENSVFRLKNPDMNLPFSDEKLKAGEAWSHKLTILIHYSVGVNKDAVVCPRTFREACPICEKRDKLIREDTEKNKGIIQNLSPAKRAIYNVLIFDSDKELKKGIQIWEAPHSSIEDVLSERCVSMRTGEKKYFTIPEENWNVYFEKKGKGLSTEYRRVEIVERRKEDEFSEKELDQLYEMAYNLEELVEYRSYDAIREMLRGTSEIEETVKEEAPWEEEPEQESRFRGRGDPPASEKEDAIPEQYASCYGIQYNQLDKCEDCPKELWMDCGKEFEKRKNERKSEDKGRRSVRPRGNI